MPVGKIKWVNDVKRLGFIEQDDNKNLFAHNSVIKEKGVKSLVAGDRVIFDVVQSAKGLVADNVRKL